MILCRFFFFYWRTYSPGGGFVWAAFEWGAFFGFGKRVYRPGTVYCLCRGDNGPFYLLSYIITPAVFFENKKIL